MGQPDRVSSNSLGLVLGREGPYQDANGDRRLAFDYIHFWPFDGWKIATKRSAIAEAYRALWSRAFAREGRTSDQHDAYSIAARLSRADGDGSLAVFLHPALTGPEWTTAQVEGWILGLG